MIDGLRGHISGLAVPTLSVFLSEAGGKVPVQPQYFLGRHKNHLLFRNLHGQLFEYPDA